MKILSGCLLLPLSKALSNHHITGSVFGWSDNGGGHNWSVKFLWTESTTFSRLPNKEWTLLKYQGDKNVKTFGDIDIIQTNDSIKIGFGFGYTGVSYHAKKDS